MLLYELSVEVQLRCDIVGERKIAIFAAFLHILQRPTLPSLHLPTLLLGTTVLTWNVTSQR